MLASLGFLVQEKFHPLFSGDGGPAIDQIPSLPIWLWGAMLAGIGSAEQAYAKICAGASAVQVYTALVYHGLALVPEIATGLDRLLARDGFVSVADAVGSKRNDWL